MNESEKTRHFVLVRINWLIDEPTSSPTAGLTCYRAEDGVEGLFSIFVKFVSVDGDEGVWRLAKFFALSEEMDCRFPSVGGRLIVTSGLDAIAEAEILSESDEEI